MSSLSKQQKQYLVAGYIRSNNSNVFDTKNMLIHEQCYLFYEETMEWQIVREMFNQFITANNGKSFVSPTIKYHDINFLYSIYPNGISRDNEGYMQCNIELISKPSDIDEIDVFFVIYLENEIIFKQSLRFSLNNRYYRLPNINNLRLSEYIHLSSLLFSFDIEILNIRYHQNRNEERFDVGKWFDYHLKYFVDIQVNQYSKYQWKLNDLILREINSTNKTFYYDEKKEDIWTMSISSDINDCLLSLHLIKLPYTIYKMNIRCKLTIKYNNYDNQDYITIIDVKNIGLSHIKTINFHHSNQNKKHQFTWPSINGLSFIWEIYVLQTFDRNGNILFNDDKQQFRFIPEIMNC